MGRYFNVSVLTALGLFMAVPQDLAAKQGRAQERPFGAAADKGLVEGPIDITRRPHRLARYGVSKAKVVRIWTHGEGKHRWFHEWQKANFADKPLLFLQVGDTPYSILVVGGKVAPLLATNTGVWRIDGLEKAFSFVQSIHVNGNSVELWTSGGDMRSCYNLQLAPRLAIQYWEEYDGP